MDNISLNTSATSPVLHEHKQAMEVAKKMEATFIADMLKHAKYGETPETLGGGAGEDQFASFLRQAQADAMAEAGGIGLAQTIFEALVSKGGLK